MQTATYVFRFNGEIDYLGSGGTITYSSTGGETPLAGVGNINAAPIMPRRLLGDYRLGKGSRGINEGSNEEWDESDLDLAGMLRIRHETIDMGAYEFQGLPGTTVLIR